MHVKSKINFLICFILIISIVISVYSVTYAFYYVEGHTIDITKVFVPHQGFGETSLLHFQNAMDQWNAVLTGWEPLVRHTSQTHSLSNYTSSYNDGKNYICRQSVGTDSYLMNIHMRTVDDILVEADINVNMSHSWANSATGNRYDVWSAFVHEMGHLLGLAHQDEELSVMKSGLSKNESRRYLYTYDIELCKILYDY